MAAARSTMLRPQVLRTPSTSHCVPEEPVTLAASPRSSVPSLSYSSSSEPDEDLPAPQTIQRQRRASTHLIANNAADIQRLVGAPGTRLLEKCCGGGCCMAVRKDDNLTFTRIPLPDNEAYRALNLNITDVPTTLSNVLELPPKTIALLPAKDGKSPSLSPADSAISVSSPPPLPESQTTDSIDFTPHNDKSSSTELLDTKVHPPSFVQPHPPYHVFSAKIHNTRSLTRPGAEKRTYHFDLDVTGYPEELGLDFKVGGAIGVVAPNKASAVEELMDLLLIPRFIRDRPVLLTTQGGRWPTVWGEEKPRQLLTTRRALLTWCSDIQSYPPTKPLLRVLAEYATDPNEKKILLFLCSGEGQGVFCDFRTGPHVTINQLLHAFPSSKPPLDHLLTQLQQLMPRFYSLSNDPHDSCIPSTGSCKRIVEIAVTVHETPDWRDGNRTGVGSGFFERQALEYIAAVEKGENPPDLRIPMFKGLMANPLAREFVSDGPMLLIGAGVGVAPFRGFVQRRLKSANCANKVWVLQGIRDSLLDELYSGEWGVHEEELKKVVASRRSTRDQKGKYVQDEVRNQADLVWWIINSLDGRVFVCGSSKGMGEGVEEALVDVAMKKGNLGREEARDFWALKKEAGQYVAETW
ncbi:hypothetical protein F5884DRAFT_454237 [Xylogone sp. PMI_703]|nr:hypothetical protein F5884DRAFT_454237 [Xylogone sp. PMI_703]